MTRIAAWLDQHRINAVTVVDTVAILVLASIIILVFSRLLWRLLQQQEFRLPPHVAMRKESHIGPLAHSARAR